jgi:hypothetical protein
MILMHNHSVQTNSLIEEQASCWKTVFSPPFHTILPTVVLFFFSVIPDWYVSYIPASRVS